MYSNDEIIKEQSGVATIITRFQLEVDWKEATLDMRYKTSGNLKYSFKAYDILPGNHRVALSYSRPESRQGNYIITPPPHRVGIRYDFEAGKIYWITFRGSDEIIVEEGLPKRIGEYDGRSFNPDKIIESIRKSRLLP
jgi:hypothetical protein